MIFDEKIENELKFLLIDFFKNKDMPFVDGFCYMGEIYMQCASIIGISKDDFKQLIEISLEDYVPLNQSQMVELLIKSIKKKENKS